MWIQSLKAFCVLVLLVAFCGVTACRKGASSSSAPPQAEVELYFVDTSRNGLSDEEMDGFVGSVTEGANKAYLTEEFAQALIDSPTWAIKDMGRTKGYLFMNAKVNAVGDTVRDTITIRVTALTGDEAVAIANGLAAYLVEEMVDLRARNLENNRSEVMNALCMAIEAQKDAYWSFVRTAKELDYDAEDLLEPDEIEAHPSVLDYRVELETLKELKVQLKLNELRGEDVDELQLAVERQEKVLEEAVEKISEADVRSALNDSARQKLENVMNMAIGTLRNRKREHDIWIEVVDRLQMMYELMPVEGVAVSPMLVQRHGAELVK